VQVWSARAADVALVAQVGARGDGLADLQAGLAGGGVLFEVAVLDRHAVDAADPDVVVLLLAAGQVLAGQALAVAVLDVGDDAGAGGHDPVSAAALAAHVVAPLGRVRVVVASDPDPGAVRVGNPVETGGLLDRDGGHARDGGCGRGVVV